MRGRPEDKGRSQLEILKEDVTSPVSSKGRITSPTTISCDIRQDERAAGHDLLCSPHPLKLVGTSC